MELNECVMLSNSRGVEILLSFRGEFPVIAPSIRPQRFMWIERGRSFHHVFIYKDLTSGCHLYWISILQRPTSLYQSEVLVTDSSSVEVGDAGDE
jgi:hypothetical protein